MRSRYTLTTKDFTKDSGVEQWSHRLKINVPYKTRAKPDEQTPVILTPADYGGLEPPSIQVKAVNVSLQLFREEIKNYPVSKAVNNTKNNFLNFIWVA